MACEWLYYPKLSSPFQLHLFSHCELCIQVTPQFTEESMLPHIFMFLLLVSLKLNVFHSRIGLPEHRPERTKDAIWGSSIVTKSLSFSSLFSNTSFRYYFEEWEILECEYHSVSIVKCAGHPLCSGCWEYSHESSVSEPGASREDKARPCIPRTPGRKL